MKHILQNAVHFANLFKVCKANSSEEHNSEVKMGLILLHVITDIYFTGIPGWREARAAWQWATSVLCVITACLSCAHSVRL
jgi:hypothetical protein